MPLAALILAHIDEDGEAAAQPLLLTLGGQTLLERLVYQSIRVGCSHVVLCAGPLPAAMLSAMDRLKARGIDISLAREPREAADRLHPEEDALVFANALVLSDADVAAISTAQTGTVLTVPEAWGRDRFERIDSTDNWTGLALLPARLIRETVAMLGEWSFGPTLLRRVVQQGVARQPVGLVSEHETDEIAPILRDDLRGAARAISRSVAIHVDGLFEACVLLPLARPLASWVSLKPVSAGMLALTALALAAGAIALAAFGQSIAGLALIVVAAFAALLTQLVGQAGIPEPRPLRHMLQARFVWLPAVLLTMGGVGLIMARLDLLAGLLCAWCAVQRLQSIHLEKRTGALPVWQPGDAALALCIALGFALGYPVAGLGVALLLLLAVHIAAQQKLKAD